MGAPRTPGSQPPRLFRTNGTTKQLATIADCPETPYFNDIERTDLALTKAITRLTDRPDSLANVM